MLLAAVLVVSACGSGGNGDTVLPGDDGDGVEVSMAPNDATARFVGVEIVWALDGEPVGAEFDYTEPIARDRYDAGLRFDATFETTGDLGDIEAALDADLFLRVQINGDRIDGSATFGPERSITRPDRSLVEVVDIDGGFVARYPMGLPLSPISLVDARERARESGLLPDEEIIEFDDTDLQFDAARLLDFPRAPENGRNEFIIELFGTIEFQNGFELDVEDGRARNELLEQLVVAETETVRLPPERDCATQTERYLELLAEEAVNGGAVLLDRVRAFGRIVERQRDSDCGVRDFDIPVCEAATAAAAPASLLERHLALCPDELELVEATVFEPRFEDGVVRLVVPATRDGLPAYSVAMGFPAWTVQTTSEGATRQKIALSNDPDTAGRFTRVDIDVSAMPASLLEERAAAAVEPENADAEILLADTTTIAGLPARRLIAQLEPGVFQVASAVELDSERLLTITGTIIDRAELPVDGDGLATLMACIETSMVVVEFEPDVDPAPAGDCTSVVELSASEVAPDLAAEPSASVDGSTLAITVPGVGDKPFHVVTVTAPEWPIISKRETDEEQFIKIDQDEVSASFVRVRAEETTDYQAAADEEAAAPFDTWTVLSEETRTLGDRALRVVVMEWAAEETLRGKIITQVDETHILVVEVNIDGPGDFDSIFATALESLTIVP